MVNYPTSLDNDTTLYLVVDNIDDYLAAHHNALKDAVIAVQTALGITGSFNFATDAEMSSHESDTSTHGKAEIAGIADLHAQSHNNTYHSTNYEAANANIQSHVGSPPEDSHHAKSHNNTEHSTNYATEADLMIGAGNSAWIPCMFIGIQDSNDDSYYIYQSTNIRNTGATDVDYAFVLPLPTNRGGRKLYINTFRLYCGLLNGTNYVTRVSVKGIYDDASPVNEWLDSTDKTTSGQIDYDLSDLDVSGYDQINLEVQTTVATAGYTRISGVWIECYYA